MLRRDLSKEGVDGPVPLGTFEPTITRKWSPCPLATYPYGRTVFRVVSAPREEQGVYRPVH